MVEWYNQIVLARDLQSRISKTLPKHHFKITDEAIILNFRNTPDKELIKYLKTWKFELVPDHISRKYIYRNSGPTRIREENDK